MFHYIFLLVLPALAAGQIDMAPYRQSAEVYFNYLNTNGNNEVTFPEFEGSFAKYDANNDSQINPHEFTTYVESFDSTGAQHHFSGVDREMFNFLDMNNDHHLNADDYRLVYDAADANSDGTVDRTEFMNYWSQAYYNADNASPANQPVV